MKRDIEKFKSSAKDKGLDIRETSPHWPYDYNDDFKAYEVDFNKNTFYFCFGSDGQLLSKKVFDRKN